MNNTFKFNLKTMGNEKNGILAPLEYGANIPFNVNRIFYTYNVPNSEDRGAHAYYNTEQVLICLCGSLCIKCFDGQIEYVYELNKPDEGIYIPPNIWRTSFNHSSDAVLLVLSSIEYDEEDYIRDYEKFMEVVGCI